MPGMGSCKEKDRALAEHLLCARPAWASAGASSRDPCVLRAALCILTGLSVRMQPAPGPFSEGSRLLPKNISEGQKQLTQL